MTKAHSTNDFRAANNGTPSNTIAMVVDLPLDGYYDMDINDFRAALTEFGKTINGLREKEIPFLWVTMQQRHQFYPATTNIGKPARRGDLQETWLTGNPEMPESQHDKSREFRAAINSFINKFGPTTNETIYTKLFMSAFSKPEDYSRLAKQQFRPDIEIEVPESGDSLERYLEQQGIQNIVMFGAFADQCIAHNIFDAANAGFNVTALSDRIIAWDETQQLSTMIWNNADYSETIKKVFMSFRTANRPKIYNTF